MASRVDDEEHFRGSLLQWKVPGSAHQSLARAGFVTVRSVAHALPEDENPEHFVVQLLGRPADAALDAPLISPDAAALRRVFKECLSLIPGRHELPMGAIEALSSGPRNKLEDWFLFQVHVRIFAFLSEDILSTPGWLPLSCWLKCCWGPSVRWIGWDICIGSWMIFLPSEKTDKLLQALKSVLK